MIRWVHEEKYDGRISYRLGNEGSSVVAEWVGLASFRSDRTPRLIPDPDADPSRLRKVTFGAVRAIERALENQWSLHGAAIAVRGEGHLFIGESGAGKSTLAATLVQSYGADLLADDMAFVDLVDERFRITPGEREHWLHRPASGLGPATASSNLNKKVPIEARSVAAQPVVLAAICEVVVDQTIAVPTLTALKGVDAMLATSKALFLLSPHVPHEVCRHLDAVAGLVHSVPLCRLRRPWAGDSTAVAEAYLRASVDPRG
ncbi:hypothetical protein BH09MYX1_BH09MYX1_53820 [soil metagenome]